MLRVCVVCDKCGKKESITYSDKKTIAVSNVFCPNGWKVLWQNGKYKHYCADCVRKNRGVEQCLKKSV